jgi:ribonucleoside-diphosphate reductase alpha chain
MEVSDAARILLSSRYLLPGETPGGMIRRVARAVNTTKCREFLSIMEDLRFLPNSPTLMNAGTAGGQLSACFVLPVEDSIDRIFTTLGYMARIHKSGGGTGFSFSHLRPQGDQVAGTAGIASGPLPFLRVFDEATNALRQGGKRRGANMGVLSSSHPDILQFIRSKEGGGLTNFNLSVGFDSSFFRHLEGGRPYDLVNPRDGRIWKTVDPSILWETLAASAWKCGDPGVLFLDRINETSSVPGLGPIEATNPCGEQPLLPFESCNLGSINLCRCICGNEMDYGILGSVVRLAVEFLDAVIDVNRFPFPEIRESTLATRKIGLGVMGFADMLILMGIPYQSREALDLAGSIMNFIQTESHAASSELGEEKGSFPAVDKSVYSGPMRNATVTTIAPTGSIHLIAGTSSGIEPVFSLAFDRMINGKKVRFIHPALEEHIGKIAGGGSMMDTVRRTGSVQDLRIGDDKKDLLRTAAEIDPEFHVRMQAVFQEHVDNAVSKTVNLPKNATPGDICRIFSLARSLHCKGITVYRYHSRADQILSRGCETCRVDSMDVEAAR